MTTTADAPTSPVRDDTMRTRIGHAYRKPPFHYTKGEEVTILFETDREVLETLLPPPLRVGRRALAVFRVMRHARSTFGPYTGVYLGAIAVFEDETVFHLFTGLKTDFAGTVAGREIWGMPLQLGHVVTAWEGDVLRLQVGRTPDVPLAEGVVHLTGRTAGPKRAVPSTYEVGRPTFDSEPVENLLVELVSEGSTEGAEFWAAEGSLRLHGTDPRDDWSLLPVLRVVDVSYSAGGTTVLNYGRVKARW
jgi:hypothetical protein